MADNKNLGDYEKLLDATLDDLADAPEFAPFHPGLHEVELGFETKVVNKHPSVSMKMKLLNTIELADSNLEPQKPGSETNVLFMLDNEMGQGNLKKILTVLKAHFGTSTNRETMDKAQGAVVKVLTKQQKKDKNDPNSPVYTNVVEMVIG